MVCWNNPGLYLICLAHREINRLTKIWLLSPSLLGDMKGQFSGHGILNNSLMPGNSLGLFICPQNPSMFSCALWTRWNYLWWIERAVKSLQVTHIILPVLPAEQIVCIFFLDFLKYAQQTISWGVKSVTETTVP